MLFGNEVIFVFEGLLCLVFFVVFMDVDLKYVSEFFKVCVILLLMSMKLIVDCFKDYYSKIGLFLVGDLWI